MPVNVEMAVGYLKAEGERYDSLVTLGKLIEDGFKYAKFGGDVGVVYEIIRRNRKPCRHRRPLMTNRNQSRKAIMSRVLVG